MGRQRTIVLALTLVVAVSGLVNNLIASAYAPANQYFYNTWERTDRLVADGQVGRTWMWGPEAFSQSMSEPYGESSGGQRAVQYFDKARMEITHPSSDTSSIWYVTNGLLVVELMTGRLQLGDDTFEQHNPADVNVGGDADDPTGLTYAVIAQLRGKPALSGGAAITQRVNSDGATYTDDSLAQYGATAAHRVTVPGIDHQVASVFWNFMNSDGAVWSNGGANVQKLFLDPFFATGYPVTEAYWANIKVGGSRVDVLIQCFERRCLTYNPANSAEWRVEAGNVGQHYYHWRHVQIPGEQSPPATQPPSATPSPPPTEPTPTPTPAPAPAPTTPDFQIAGFFGGAWDPATVMSAPAGVGISPNGSVVVSDFNANRVQVYDEKGKFVRQFGTQGSSDGQFNGPTGVAVANTLGMYIVDSGNARIQVFDGLGNYVTEVTGIDTGGNIIHTFQQPNDIAIDGSGRIWVIDTGRQQLMKYSYDGSPGGVFGTPGTGPGQFSQPVGIGIDADDHIWVADAGRKMILEFDNNGSFVSEYPHGGPAPADVAYINGEYYVIDSFENRLFRNTKANWTNQVSFGSTGETPGTFNGMVSIAVDGHGNFWIADSGNGRVQNIDPNGFPIQELRDDRRGKLTFPHGVDVLGNGSIFVADTLLSRIQQLDWNGEPLADYDANGVGSQALLYPTDVAVHDEDVNNWLVYVADTGNNRIVQYTQYGESWVQWGGYGSGPGQFDSPTSLDTDSSGNVYVADSGNGRIQKFDANGTFITEWQVCQNVCTQPFASGIAVYGNAVYVVDQANHIVLVFDADGNYLDSWGELGSGPAQLNTPSDIEVDNDGIVYVADTLNGRIQGFTPDGIPVGTWGDHGSQLFLLAPIDIGFYADGTHMYVTDRDAHVVVDFLRVAGNP